MNCRSPIWLEFYQIAVPCGKCTLCKIAHSREWAVRLVHEMSNFDYSSFVTLTYRDENLPEKESISKRELQLFFKRLRKNLDGREIKYFAAGEYGEQNGRPHYHAVILGLSMMEKEVVEKSWKYGMVYMGTVTYDSARYVADYVQKKYNGNKALMEYGEKEAPFQLQSLGVGRRYAEANKKQILENLSITMYGDPVGIPRYYKRLLGLDASVLGEAAQERKKELTEKILNKVKDPGYVRRQYLASLEQAEKNAKARIQLKRDRVKK